MVVLLVACVGGDPSDSPPDSPVDSTPVDTGERDPLRDLDPSVLDAATSPCRDPILMKVTEVHDGDTATMQNLEVTWQTEKVRFIGIDTPELSGTECWSREATDALKEAVADKVVWLTFGRECEDQYDRTLAYVHRGEDTFVNVEMVRDGHAFAFPYEPNTTFEGRFEAAEQAARGEDAGMWADCY